MNKKVDTRIVVLVIFFALLLFMLALYFLAGPKNMTYEKLGSTALVLVGGTFLVYIQLLRYSDDPSKVSKYVQFRMYLAGFLAFVLSLLLGLASYEGMSFSAVWFSIAGAILTLVVQTVHLYVKFKKDKTI